MAYLAQIGIRGYQFDSLRALMAKAAPGALLSVMGGRVQNVRAGERPVTVLSRGERETQIQLPFDLEGSTVSLSLEAEGGWVRSSLPLAVAETVASMNMARPSTCASRMSRVSLAVNVAEPRRVVSITGPPSTAPTRAAVSGCSSAGTAARIRPALSRAVTRNRMTSPGPAPTSDTLAIDGSEVIRLVPWSKASP